MLNIINSDNSLVLAHTNHTARPQPLQMLLLACSIGGAADASSGPIMLRASAYTKQHRYCDVITRLLACDAHHSAALIITTCNWVTLQPPLLT